MCCWARPVRIDVVTGAKGLDTSGGSFGYVAGWAPGHPEQVRDAAQTVLRAARTTLDTTTPDATSEDIGENTDTEEGLQE